MTARLATVSSRRLHSFLDMPAEYRPAMICIKTIMLSKGKFSSLTGLDTYSASYNNVVGICLQPPSRAGERLHIDILRGP